MTPRLHYVRRAGASILALVLAGCASAQRPVLGRWEGPSAPVPVDRSRWSPPSRASNGECLTTAHYRIYTTVDDPTVRAALPEVMEGALAEYEKLVPGITLTDRPMDCYVFGQRREWSDFTRGETGSDARIYLQISRGGYTVRDRFVAYYLGPYATYSVASHEGFHQFVARHFKGRIPPFLEEGLATTFESVQWDDGEPRWNRSININRAQALRNVLDVGATYPLDRLVTMHAGQVVDKSGEKIEAFYSQAWAFARFLWEADGARYRPALQRLLLDTARGTVEDPTGPHRGNPNAWRPASVKPVLEHYLGLPWSQIDRRYKAFMRKAAYDEINGQFQS